MMLKAGDDALGKVLTPEAVRQLRVNPRPEATFRHYGDTPPAVNIMHYRFITQEEPFNCKPV